jgi:hypothetical protein
MPAGKAEARAQGRAAPGEAQSGRPMLDQLSGRDALKTRHRADEPNPRGVVPIPLRWSRAVSEKEGYGKHHPNTPRNRSGAHSGMWALVPAKFLMVPAPTPSFADVGPVGSFRQETWNIKHQL